MQFSSATQSFDDDESVDQSTLISIFRSSSIDTHSNQSEDEYKRTHSDTIVLKESDSISSSLRTVYNDQYVVYDNSPDIDSLFQKWWSSTSYVVQIVNKITDLFSSEWSSRKRASSIWNEYHQIAISKSDRSKIMCMRCYKVYEHSNNLRIETSTLRLHIDDKNCKKRQKIQDTSTKSQDVRNFLRSRNLVSSILLIKKKRNCILLKIWIAKSIAKLLINIS